MILDTSAAVSLFRGNEKANDFLNSTEEIFLPLVVLGELYCGLRKCSNLEKERGNIEKLKSRTISITINENVAYEYSQISQKLEKNGTPIPTNDMWIAAIAIQHQLPLLAKDKHFDLVDGLKVLKI